MMHEDIGTHEIENHQPDTLEKQIEQMINEDIGAHETANHQPDTLERQIEQMMGEDIGTREVENHQPDTLEKQIEQMMDKNTGTQEDQKEPAKTDAAEKEQKNRQETQEEKQTTEEQKETKRRKGKEQTKVEKGHRGHESEELGELLEEQTNKEKGETTGKVKCKTDMNKDKESSSGAGTNGDSRTRTQAETRIAHKEEDKKEKRTREETEREDIDKGETEAETKTRIDEKEQKSKETTEDTKERERISWERIGLVEFNEKTMKWECRIEDCQEEMDTAKKIARHRKKCHDEQYYGPNKQEVYCPYCGKSLSTTSNMLIHMKIQPQKGEWDTETCHKLISEDTPRDKWAKLVLGMKGNIPEIKLREWKYAHPAEKEVATRTKASKRQNQKEKGVQKYKEKEGEERRLSREREGQQAEKGQKDDQKGDRNNKRQDQKNKKGNDFNTKEKGVANPQGKKGAQQHEIARRKNIFEIILTQPQEKEGGSLTQMTAKPQQNTKHLQVPAARRSKKTKRRRENTRENNDQESKEKKRCTDANIEQNKTTNEVDKGREQDNEQREKQKDGPDKKGNNSHKTITVTIQTGEGQYETTLTEETDEECPLKQIIEKLGLTRYRIPQPPEMMHNIPKHYTTKGLVNGTVLKFDIRRPTNNERLWNKQTESEKTKHKNV